MRCRGSRAALRVVVGLALVPYGLRMVFGLFPDSRPPVTNLPELTKQLHAGGYRPARLWAPAIALTELVAGPMLAIGAFTRIAAIPVFLFLLVANIERWRVGGYFWNTLGLEYTLLWTFAAAYLVVHGGGPISVDHLLFGFEF